MRIEDVSLGDVFQTTSGEQEVVSIDRTPADMLVLTMGDGRRTAPLEPWREIPGWLRSGLL